MSLGRRKSLSLDRLTAHASDFIPPLLSPLGTYYFGSIFEAGGRGLFVVKMLEVEGECEYFGSPLDPGPDLSGLS